MRSSGILLPISALPSKYGIGAFDKNAYEFIDQIKKAGMKYWQILPLGTTGYGDSPYQSFSAYAGNPYFIDLDDLLEKGLLKSGECEQAEISGHIDEVDYAQLYETRYQILRIAFSRFDCNDLQYQKFLNENKHWLPDFALFMAVKNENQGISWNLWEDGIRKREPSSLKHYREKCKKEMHFIQFMQYMFFSEWNILKAYANQKGVEIIGDIPIYVAYDSADTWTQPKLFRLNKNLEPLIVAGCPPDPFSETGQLWGNPIYDWKYHKETDYQWWAERMQATFALYDVVRVDHFRGFESFYQIPYGEETAQYGSWEKGPGEEFFFRLKEKLGPLNIIAEDLGYVTPSVIEMLHRTGFPGMKVLQFAFDSRESGEYSPETYEENSVVYTGTHDNDTLIGWYHSISVADRQKVRNYAKIKKMSDLDIAWKLIETAFATKSKLCVIPMQDFLGLDSSARMNTPSTLGGNWKWRMRSGDFSDEMCKKIRDYLMIYQR